MTHRVLHWLALASFALTSASLWAADMPRVRFETTQGNFIVELNPEKAPKSVENFLKYVEDKHYDGTLFHRVMPGFVAQAGGYTEKMSEKPTRAPIPLESQNGLGNELGTVAMARTGDPNSATAQFYINLTNNTRLNYPQPDGFGYAVFGKVIDGMEVVKKIAQVRTGSVNGMDDVPLTPIVIKTARLLTEKKPSAKNK